MPKDQHHVGESASVQITPAAADHPNATPPGATPGLLPEDLTGPHPTPLEETSAVTASKPGLIHKIGGLLGALLLVSLVACTPNTAPTSPSHESAGMDDSASVATVSRPSWVPANVPFVHTSDDTHPVPTWHAHVDVAKCVGEVAVCTAGQAYEVVSADHNLLMTAGATALWNGLSTSGLGTPFNTTNAQLAVGDGSTAPAVGNTDLAAAAGTKINAADVSSCTNATPIVCAGTYSPAAVAGGVYVFSGFTGAGASAINGTFEASAGSAASITLLNSAGSGSITVTGATIQPINKYRQQANASGSAVVSGAQITYVATFGTTNGNFAWNEWGVTTGAAATNKQAVPPPTILNRATPGGGLGTKTSAASWTLTVTLSLS